MAAQEAFAAAVDQWRESGVPEFPRAWIIQTARHKIIDRVIADNIRISGSHFPFPGTGVFVKDGNAYGFTPVQI